MEKKCLQLTNGPTPCFREAGLTICSLDFCPVAIMLERYPGNLVFGLLHSHCVMSENYGQQNDFTVGLGEFIAAIAKLK